MGALYGAVVAALILVSTLAVTNDKLERIAVALEQKK